MSLVKDTKEDTAHKTHTTFPLSEPDEPYDNKKDSFLFLSPVVYNPLALVVVVVVATSYFDCNSEQKRDKVETKKRWS